MKRFLRRLLILLLLVVLAAGGYGWLGYRDARDMTETLRVRADALIAADRGGAGLGVDRRQMLIDVMDPAYLAHVGVDFTTPGAGDTTISQQVARRLAFDTVLPGIVWLRHTGYALALERNLSKPQILALFLDTVPMGPGPDGAPINGLWPAAEAHFGAAPGAVPERDFLALLAVMIAPDEVPLADPGPRLADRIARIERLLAGQCRPLGHDDIWLDGCA